MPAELRVVTEDLHVSAAAVDTHADSMRTRHGAADGRIESSHVGLPAGAATALAAAVSKWQADTSTLYGQLVDHGHGLREGAAAYHANDQDGAANITAVGESAAAPDLGL